MELRSGSWNAYLKPRVLVTGATGFIGSKLVASLLARDYDVTVIARSPNSILRCVWRNRVNVIQADLTDYSSLISAVKSDTFSTVVHMGGVVRRISRRVPEDEYFAVNVEGTRNICELCAAKDIRKMIHMSTADVHGSIPRGKIPINEDYPYCPSDAYSKTKIMAEKVVRRFSQDKELDARILRPTHVYGPGDPGFVPRMFNLVRLLPSIPIVGDGRTLKHFVYIDDLIDLILNAMRSRARGRAYLVADDTPLPVFEFLRLLCEVQMLKRHFIRIPVPENISKILRPAPENMRYPISWFYSNHAYDTSLAKHELSFKPRTRIEKGLRTTYSSISGKTADRY